MHLELNDEQIAALERVGEHRPERSLPPQSPYRGPEGDPRDDAAGAGTSGTAAPVAELGAAEHFTKLTAPPPSAGGVFRPLVDGRGAPFSSPRLIVGACDCEPGAIGRGGERETHFLRL